MGSRFERIELVQFLRHGPRDKLQHGFRIIGCEDRGRDEEEGREGEEEDSKQEDEESAGGDGLAAGYQASVEPSRYHFTVDLFFFLRDLKRAVN